MKQIKHITLLQIIEVRNTKYLHLSQKRKMINIKPILKKKKKIGFHILMKTQ